MASTIRQQTVDITPVISLTTYSSGDQIGGIQTLPIGLCETLLVEVENIQLTDLSVQNAAITFHFFNSLPVLLSTDNQPFSISPAELTAKLIISVTLPATNYQTVSSVGVGSLSLGNVNLKASPYSPGLLYCVAVINQSATYLTTSAIGIGYNVVVYDTSDTVLITNGQLAAMNSSSIKGNNLLTAGSALDLTTTQTTAMLNAMTGDSGAGGLKGMVPAQAIGDATKYLTGAGTWGVISVPPSANPALSNLTAPTSLNQNLTFQPTFGLTLPNHINGITSLTASTILSADTNKNLVSLSTGSYPDLTELSYVKGVTSAIQTQINNIATLPSQISNAGKVLATDGATSSWQFAGLATGGLGTNNLMVGRLKPTGLTGTGVTVVGAGSGTALTTGSNLVILGSSVAAGQTIHQNSVFVGDIGNSANSSNGNTIAIGWASTGGGFVNGANTYESVLIGTRAYCASGSVVIGDAASNQGNSGVAIGQSANGWGLSVAIGAGSGGYATTSAVAIGAGAITRGSTNGVSIGNNSGALNSNIDLGVQNTCIGSYAGGAQNSALATKNVFLGYYAGGRNTNQANNFFVDNQDRTTYANQQSQSLLYGVFNATASSQTLAVNAALSTPYTLAVSGVATFADSVRGTNGSVSAPSYSFTGSTNSGLYFSAATCLGYNGGIGLSVDGANVNIFKNISMYGTTIYAGGVGCYFGATFLDNRLVWTSDVTGYTGTGGLVGRGHTGTLARPHRIDVAQKITIGKRITADKLYGATLSVSGTDDLTSTSTTTNNPNNSTTIVANNGDPSGANIDVGDIIYLSGESPAREARITALTISYPSVTYTVDSALGDGVNRTVIYKEHIASFRKSDAAEVFLIKNNGTLKSSYGEQHASLHALVGTTNIITAATSNYYLGVDCSAAAKTVNLPSASAAGQGFVLVVKDEFGASLTNNIVIDGSGAETIDGLTTKTINLNYGSVRLICSGSAWFTM